VIRPTLVAVALVPVALVASLSTAALGQDWASKMLSATTHDFGSVARSAKVQQRIVVKNLYKEDVHIAGVRVSCGCISASATRDVLATHETGEIVIDLNTRSFLGRRTATATVTFDRPYYAEARINISAYIRSDVVFTPGVVDFGTVHEGLAAEKKITVLYAGRDDWKIVDVTSANSNYEVAVTEKSRGGGRVSYELSVRLKDGTPAGYVNDPLTLVTNDSNLKRVPLYVEGRITPSVTVSPASLNLGVVKPGQKVTRLLIVKGNEPFRIIGVDCGDRCFEFKVSETAKTQHRIPVTFTAGEKPGNIAERIRIKTDRSTVECLASASVVAS
jgi:hypothetical protein